MPATDRMDTTITIPTARRWASSGRGVTKVSMSMMSRIVITTGYSTISTGTDLSMTALRPWLASRKPMSVQITA